MLNNIFFVNTVVPIAKGFLTKLRKKNKLKTGRNCGQLAKVYNRLKTIINHYFKRHLYRFQKSKI
jgi:hypothetical protein